MSKAAWSWNDYKREHGQPDGPTGASVASRAEPLPAGAYIRELDGAVMVPDPNGAGFVNQAVLHLMGRA